MTSTCPRCGDPLGPAQARCGRCGLLLVGPVAAELGQLDRHLAFLGQRRQQLLAQLVQEPGPTDAPVPYEASPLPVPLAHWSAQRVLLGLGVLLVVVAGLVFVAVSWRTLGVAGQVAVVTGAAVAAAVASRVLESRRLTASAEAAAVLAAGLLVVGLVAARTLGLAGLDQVDEAAYASASAGIVALVCAAAGLRSALRAWPVVAVVAAAVSIPLAISGFDADPVTGVVAFALGAGGFWLLRFVPPGWLRVQEPGRVAAVVFAVAAWLVAPLAVWSDESSRALVCSAVGVLVSTAVVVGCTRRGGPAGLWDARALLGRTAVVAAAVQLTAGASAQPAAASAAVAVLAGVVLLAASWAPAPLRPRWAGIAAATAAGTLPLVSLSLLTALEPRSAPGWGLLEPLTRDAAWWAVLVAAAVDVAVGLALAARRPRWRVGASAYAAVSLVVGATVASSTTVPAVLVVTTAVTGALLAVWAYRSRGLTEVVVGIAAVAAQGVACAAALAAFDALTPAGAVLSVAGVVALAYGLRPGRGWLWWVGAVAVPAGVWMVLVDSEVDTIEAYSLPLAASCLLAGGLGRRRHPGTSSWAAVGPALAVGLLPSALVSIDDEALLRPLLVLGVAVALVLLGAWRRWQAVVVVPAIAVVVVAVSQLAPYAMGAPRWLSLGLLGAVLLAVGVRYEARRRNVVSASRWLRDLH